MLAIAISSLFALGGIVGLIVTGRCVLRGIRLYRFYSAQLDQASAIPTYRRAPVRRMTRPDGATTNVTRLPGRPTMRHHLAAA